MSEIITNTPDQTTSQNFPKRVCLSVEGEPQIPPEVLQDMGMGIMRGRLDVDRDFN